MLLKDFMEKHYWPFCEKAVLLSRQMRISTAVGYESYYRNHISPTFGNSDLDSISVKDVESWLMEFKTTGCAKKSYATFRAILRKAYKWGITDNDVTRKDITQPKHRRRKQLTLNAKQINAMLNSFKGHELEALVIVSVCLGLRRGEACALHWGDIDLTTGQVNIYASRQYIKRKIRVEECKTDKSKRTVYLPEFALRKLRKIKHNSPDELICPLSPDAVSRKYKAHIIKNKLPYTPLSNLRHTYATNSLRAGNDIAVVSRTLGHADITTTARYYLAPSLDMIKEAQEKFNTLMEWADYD